VTGSREQREEQRQDQPRARPGARGWDRWAPVYHGLERLALGRELERCRDMAADALAVGAGSPLHCLVLGDGDGRGLERLVDRHPATAFTSVDVSPGMITRARRRLGGAPGVTWVCADIREGWPEALEGSAGGGHAGVDAVMTQFFLDCFTDEELSRWWSTVAERVSPGGCWVVADFTPPTALRGWRGVRQRLLLEALYRAFGWTTPLTARALPDLEGIFRSAGWSLEFTRESPSRITGVRLWRAP
jgi:SAM-dependent methyltransferase